MIAASDKAAIHMISAWACERSPGRAPRIQTTGWNGRRAHTAWIMFASHSRQPRRPPSTSSVWGCLPAVCTEFGKNGSGKTTLLKVMAGLYEPRVGRVLVDGADLAHVSRAQLADWIGYIPPDTYFFRGTIHENIAHGKVGASEYDVIATARRAVEQRRKGWIYHRGP